MNPHPRTALLSLLLSLAPVCAGAQTPEELYEQGLDAFREGDHALARERFEAARRNLPPGHALRSQTLYNLGRVAQETGEPCQAAERFDEYLHVASRDDPAEATRMAKARTALDESRAECRSQAAAAAPAPAAPGPPARAADTVKPATPPADRAGVTLGLSLGGGLLVADGVERTHLVPEALVGHRWSGLHAELALAATVESPLGLFIRPGTRLDLLELTENGPLYLRAATQLLVTPLTTVGVLLGPGVEFPLAAEWAFTCELTASVWAAAPSLVPIEARLGARHAF